MFQIIIAESFTIFGNYVSARRDHAPIAMAATVKRKLAKHPVWFMPPPVDYYFRLYNVILLLFYLL